MGKKSAYEFWHSLTEDQRRNVKTYTGQKRFCVRKVVCHYYKARQCDGCPGYWTMGDK